MAAGSLRATGPAVHRLVFKDGPLTTTAAGGNGTIYTAPSDVKRVTITNWASSTFVSNQDAYPFYRYPTNTGNDTGNGYIQAGPGLAAFAGGRSSTFYLGASEVLGFYTSNSHSAIRTGMYAAEEYL
jgi:hypothetical protein